MVDSAGISSCKKRVCNEVSLPVIYNGLPLRHELKYYIPYADYMAMRGRLSAFMLPDEHMDDLNGYHVRSLYFDDPAYSARFEKINGYRNRSKTRVRIYNKSLGLIRLEKKIKLSGVVGKRTAELTHKELGAILDNDTGILLQSQSPVVHEFYADQKLRRLRPVVLVDYVREAYKFTAGNVRITFDHDLQGAVGDFDHSLSDEGLICRNAYPPGLVMMEVKYDDFLPAAVKRIIRPYTARRSAVSKYVLALKAVRIGEIYGVGGLFPAIRASHIDADDSAPSGDADTGDSGRAVHILHL